MSRFNIQSTNQNSLPYNLINDTLRIKVALKKGIQPSYASGVTITIYANTGPGSSTVILGTAVTDEFGVAVFLLNTNLITNKKIDTADVWASVNINGNTIYSNRTITNFIIDETIQLDIYIIDANDPTTRLNASGDYNIYDANTPATRVAASGDYWIIDRSNV